MKQSSTHSLLLLAAFSALVAAALGIWFLFGNDGPSGAAVPKASPLAANSANAATAPAPVVTPASVPVTPATPVTSPQPSPISPQYAPVSVSPTPVVPVAQPVVIDPKAQAEQLAQQEVIARNFIYHGDPRRMQLYAERVTRNEVVFKRRDILDYLDDHIPKRAWLCPLREEWQPQQSTVRQVFYATWPENEEPVQCLVTRDVIIRDTGLPEACIAEIQHERSWYFYRANLSTDDRANVRKALGYYRYLQHLDDEIKILVCVDRLRYDAAVKQRYQPERGDEPSPNFFPNEARSRWLEDAQLTLTPQQAGERLIRDGAHVFIVYSERQAWNPQNQLIVKILK